MISRSKVGRRIALVVALIGALAALCVTSALAAHSSKAVTDLKIWTWDDTQLQSVDAGFVKAHPEITLNYVKMSAPTLYQKVQLSAASGGEIGDVLTIEDSNVGQMIKLGVLADITKQAAPYNKKITAYKWNEVTVGGKVYAFPWDAGPVALFYRRDVFKKAGVDPASLQTWADWIAAGKKIKSQGSALWLQGKATNNARFFERLLWQQGSGYIDAKGNVTLDKDPRALAAINLIGQGWKSGLFGDITEWTDGWYKAISGGKSATLPMAAWMGGFLKGWLAPDNKGLWGIVPLPAFTKGGSKSANDGGSSLSISKSSSNKDAAWQYIQYHLGRADVQSHMWQSTDFFPSLISAWRSPYPRTADPYYAGQPAQSVFTKAAKNIPVGHVYSADYQQMNGIMSTHLQAFALGKESATGALKNAAKEIRSKTGRK